MEPANVHGQVGHGQELHLALASVALEQPLVVRLAFAVVWLSSLCKLPSWSDGGAAKPCPEDRDVRGDEVFARRPWGEEYVNYSV